MYRGAWYIWRIGNGREAENLAIRAIKTRASLLGKRHEDTVWRRRKNRTPGENETHLTMSTASTKKLDFQIFSREQKPLVGNSKKYLQEPTRSSARIKELKEKNSVSTEKLDTKVVPQESMTDSKRQRAAADLPVRKAILTRKRSSPDDEKDYNTNTKKPRSSSSEVSGGQAAPVKKPNAGVNIVQGVVRLRAEDGIGPLESDTVESTLIKIKETKPVATKEPVVSDIEHIESPIKRALRSSTKKAEQAQDPHTGSAIETKDVQSTPKRAMKRKTKPPDKSQVTEPGHLDSSSRRSTRLSTNNKEDSNASRGDSIESKTNKDEVLSLENIEAPPEDTNKRRRKTGSESVDSTPVRTSRRNLKELNEQLEATAKQAKHTKPTSSRVTRARSAMNVSHSEEDELSESTPNERSKRGAKKKEDHPKIDIVDIDSTQAGN